MGPPQYELRHKEVVEIYKAQLFAMELELSRAKEEKDKYQDLLFKQVGLLQDGVVIRETQQPIQRPMSPGRMRSSLQIASRIAKEKKQ